jgi:hypothetical protein
MGEYRAYTVGIDGYFIGFEPLLCHDDAEAIEKAQRTTSSKVMPERSPVALSCSLKMIGA